MKIFKTVLILVVSAATWLPSFSQNPSNEDFKLSGKNPGTIKINQSFSSSTDISPIGNDITSIYGLALTADVSFNGENGLVRVTLFDENYSEYLVYETYSLLEDSKGVSIDALCEETALLEGIDPLFLRIEIKDATVKVKSVSYTTNPDAIADIPKVRKQKKEAQDQYKIKKLNNSIKNRGLLWGAGVTEVSELTYADRKKLYGEGTFPPGFEYYSGGIMSSGDNFKSGTSSTMVDTWDWRNRHGQNWVTSVKNQGSCGSCWAFGSAGAVEAQVNLFFNQSGLNFDLSEQDLVSCSGAGSCSGGYPTSALSYITYNGIVDEAAFPYAASNLACNIKSASPTQKIKIAGRVDLGYGEYPASDDNLKRMIIKYGPISAGLNDWSHAMTLVGWQVVKEGDRFYYSEPSGVIYWITVPAGSPVIGKTVWMFKNSWGVWGDGGYIYVETPITNYGSTSGILSPVQSLVQPLTVSCVDQDGDGYYWWGLGARPASCPNSLGEDGDDSNANLGPLDEFGYCMDNNAAPQDAIANFAADKNSVTPSATVAFSDLSLNQPTSWQWSFPGGTPSSSTEKNPVVKYNSAGSFNVSLTVKNSTNVNSTKTITNYIDVIYNEVKYCSSNGYAAKEWIASVALNGLTYSSGSSGTIGYQNIANSGFTVATNTVCPLKVTPGFSSKSTTEYFTVWIDFNHDMDFSDPGEQVLTAKRIKGSASGNITIPATAVSGLTTMRVSMCRTSQPGACDLMSTGEVEDYIITVSAGKAGSLISDVSVLPTLKIYPNPASTSLTLQLGEVYDHASLAIFNTNGQMLYSQSVKDAISRINVEFLPVGFYMILVNNGTNVFREKFLKE